MQTGLKLEIKVVLTPAQLAEAWCQMSDDEQAAFFVEVARLAEGWPGGGAIMQWHYLGRHLRDNAPLAARRIIEEIAGSMQEAT